MADDSSYILPSSDDDFSEEITNEMVQIPELPVATSEIEQINVISIPDSTVQISAKLQTKVSSWVWKYFIKDYNNKGEIRAYCQFVMENGDKCTKNYKYDGSTGNLSSHIIKHGIIPPTAAENLPAAEIKSKPIQSIDNIGQKEKEESTLRWILLTTQPLSTIERLVKIQKDNGYEEQLHLIQDIPTRLTNSLNPSGNLYEEEPDDSFNDLEEENSTNQQTNYDNIRETLENVKKNIYRSLRYYWKIPNEFGIMAALLDPRYKNLDFISDDSIKRKFHSTLRTRYDQLKWDISQQSIPSSPTTVTSAESLIAGSSTSSRSLRDHKARREQKAKEVFQRTEIPTSSMEDEITSYLLMPIARENKNPLDWWRVKREIFPILSLIAQKYLDLDVEKSNSEEYLSECEFEEW
ncbi:unnamed protein product [Rhizophagus irregularis]|uniref:HAT C-terminal dimerisation domain-containing protein n=1 Tax=Rhizophagus irregularis TaxID=588596 RepID=A0A916E3S7_9GLOM|nr:unnamed protein product [Rhizophagus irregularis]